MIKKIAVLTSGGDAPGMNAAIRAVVCAGLPEECWAFIEGSTVMPAVAIRGSYSDTI